MRRSERIWHEQAKLKFFDLPTRLCRDFFMHWKSTHTHRRHQHISISRRGVKGAGKFLMDVFSPVDMACKTRRRNGSYLWFNTFCLVKYQRVFREMRRGAFKRIEFLFMVYEMFLTYSIDVRMWRRQYRMRGENKHKIFEKSFKSDLLAFGMILIYWYWIVTPFHFTHRSLNLIFSKLYVLLCCITSSTKTPTPTSIQFITSSSMCETLTRDYIKAAWFETLKLLNFLSLSQEGLGVNFLITWKTLGMFCCCWGINYGEIIQLLQRSSHHSNPLETKQITMKM